MPAAEVAVARNIPPAPARGKKPYKAFGASLHGTDTPPAVGGTNSVGLQQAAGQEEKKSVHRITTLVLSFNWFSAGISMARSKIQWLLLLQEVWVLELELQSEEDWSAPSFRGTSPRSFRSKFHHLSCIFTCDCTVLFLYMIGHQLDFRYGSVVERLTAKL